MSLSFNDSGLVTFGMGEDHRLCTIGMSQRFDYGGISPRRRKLVEYDLNITAPILKTNSDEIGIYSTLEVVRNREIPIASNVSKETQDEMIVIANIDHSSLDAVLDEI